MGENNPSLQALDLAGHHPTPPSDSSLIVRFYRDGAKDTLHRTLQDMLVYVSDLCVKSKLSTSWMHGACARTPTSNKRQHYTTIYDNTAHSTG